MHPLEINRHASQWQVAIGRREAVRLELELTELARERQRDAGFVRALEVLADRAVRQTRRGRARTRPSSWRGRSTSRIFRVRSRAHALTRARGPPESVPRYSRNRCPGAPGTRARVGPERVPECRRNARRVEPENARRPRVRCVASSRPTPRRTVSRSPWKAGTSSLSTVSFTVELRRRPRRMPCSSSKGSQRSGRGSNEATNACEGCPTLESAPTEIRRRSGARRLHMHYLPVGASSERLSTRMMAATVSESA